MSAQFEHPDFPREIADAPDIDNIPVAESMHALMECVTEIYHGVRQILESMSPEATAERARVIAPLAMELARGLDETTPLDPTKVRVQKQVHWATDLKRGDVIVSVEAHNAVTVEREEPAPEPEPEWKPGTTGTATLNNRVTGNSAVGLRAMRTASREGVPGFALENGLSISDDAVTYSVSDFVPDATVTCPHGQTAEDLCNAMPDKIELDAMWAAWKSLTPAEQHGWLAGGEGKVPTPAKVSIRTLMNGGAS